MQGTIVPYEQVVGKNSYTFPNGNIFIFNEKSAIHTLKLTEPLKYIISRFTINNFN
jgi:hypothetical protein